MNKMLSFIFWMFIPLLLPMMLLGYNYGEINEPGFYLLIDNHFVKYDLFSIWIIISIYYFILGYAYKRIKADSNYYAIQALFTICVTLLFLKTMLENDFVYNGGEDAFEYYFFRIKIFFAVFSIWLFSQIWFWFKFAQNLSEEKNHDILDDPKFLDI